MGDVGACEYGVWGVDSKLGLQSQAAWFGEEVAVNAVCGDRSADV